MQEIHADLSKKGPQGSPAGRKDETSSFSFNNMLILILRFLLEQSVQLLKPVTLAERLLVGI